MENDGEKLNNSGFSNDPGDDPAPSLATFRRRIVKSGVVIREELEATERSSEHQASICSARDLALLLVSTGKLTKYQAAHIYQGKTEPLVYGGYVVREKLGAGGMGRVYKAYHGQLDRFAAVKLMRADAMAVPGAVDRFRTEAKVAAQLVHQNIVVTFDAGDQDGVCYLVMEFVNGENLAAVVERDHPLSERRVVEYCLQVANGLSYAHSKGIVHRDIKPSNLFLDVSGAVKILDMGLAGIEESSVIADVHNAPGQPRKAIGTLDFMAPEQAKNFLSATARSDVYSLGCTLYTLLTGKVVYPVEEKAAKIHAHREDSIPLLRDARPDVSAQFESVFRRMVAKRPQDRPRDMQEVIRLLQACLDARQERPIPSPVVRFDGKSALSPPQLPQSGAVATVSARDFDDVDAALCNKEENAKPTDIGASSTASSSAPHDEQPRPPPLPPKRSTPRGDAESLSPPPRRSRLASDARSATPWSGRLAYARLGVILRSLPRRVVVAGWWCCAGPVIATWWIARSADRLLLSILGRDQKIIYYFLRFVLLLLLLFAVGGGGYFLFTNGVGAAGSNFKEKNGHVVVEPQPPAEEVEPFQAPVVVEAVIPVGKSFDVLQVIDPIQDSHSGNWTFDDKGGLDVQGGYQPYKRIEAPVTVNGDYQLDVEFTRNDGNADVTLILPGGERGTFLMLSGFYGSSAKWNGYVSGLSLAPYDVVIQNETAREGSLVNEKRYKVHIDFDRDGDHGIYNVTLDGQPYLTWSGPLATLVCGSKDMWQMRHRNAIGFASRSSVTFHSAVLRANDGEVKVLRPISEDLKEVLISRPFVADADSDPQSVIAPFDDKQAKRHQQLWANHLGLAVEFTNTIGMKMVFIPAGQFQMGATDSDAYAQDDEKPQRNVVISHPFYMGITEVTQAQYDSVIGQNPSRDKGDRTRPVESVSWENAVDFCRQLSKQEGRQYRLPYEAEWEYACRAGTETRWYFGNDESKAKPYAWCNSNSVDSAHLVGLREPNSWGLYDMHGNVSEWCGDWYGPYSDPSRHPLRGPTDGSQRVFRGGSFAVAAIGVRSSFRNHAASRSQRETTGFRVVMPCGKTAAHAIEESQRVAP